MNLKTGNGSDLILVSVFKTKHKFMLEKRLHIKYHSKRLSGEWFALNDDDISNFINTCQSINDSFDYLRESGNPFI